MDNSSSFKILISALTDLSRWGPVCGAMPYHRFYWNASSGASVTYDGKRHPLSPQNFYVIPAWTLYEASISRRLYHLNCNFILTNDIINLEKGIHTIKPPKELMKTAQECMHCFLDSENNASINEFKKKLLFETLVSFCVSRLPLFVNKNNYGDDRILKVITYIKAGFEQQIVPDLNNDKLAAITGMHRNSFTRLFKQCIGDSPQHYVAARKISSACIMLHDPELNIETIAERLNYYDRYHFSREFMKQQRVSPAAFRKKLLRGG